ncbi:MAG TPA: hypothetical protein VF476_19855 [Chitinophagaceae bacterium]
MRLVLSLLMALNLICQLSSGQIVRQPLAAPYLGTGAYSLHHVDVFSIIANQASLAQLKNTSVAVYGERRFLLNELNNYRAVAAIKTSSGHFALNAGYFGFADYNESQIGLAHARKLGNKINIGAQFNYNGISIAGYGNAAAISFELGTVFHLTEKLHAGIHINNPVGGKFGKEQPEKLPSVYTVGFGFEASEKFFISSEIIKEEDQPVNVNAGMQYRFTSQLMARAGISSATTSGWLGAGLILQSFRIDIMASYHSQLGVTPGLLLLFNFKSSSKQAE